MPLTDLKKKAYLIIILSIAVISAGIALVGSFVVTNETASFSLFSRASLSSSKSMSRACERCEAAGGAQYCTDRFAGMLEEANQSYSPSINVSSLRSEYAMTRTLTEDRTTQTQEKLCRYCNFEGSKLWGRRVLDEKDVGEYNRLCLGIVPTAVPAQPLPTQSQVDQQDQPDNSPTASDAGPTIAPAQAEQMVIQEQALPVEPTATPTPDCRPCDFNGDGVYSQHDSDALTQCIFTIGESFSDTSARIAASRANLNNDYPGGDSLADAGDITYWQVYCNPLNTNTPVHSKCDLNGDGTVDAADSALITTVIYGLNNNNCSRNPNLPSGIEEAKENGLDAGDLTFCAIKCKPKVTRVGAVLSPPPNSYTPSAAGNVGVEVNQRFASGFIEVKVSGLLRGLVSNATYRVYLCNSSSNSCSTNANPTITTNQSGMATFTNMLFSHNQSLYPIDKVEVFAQTISGPLRTDNCYSTAGPPCLQAEIAIPDN